MAARLVFRPHAQADLNQLYDWIAERAGSAVALAYIMEILGGAERLVVYQGLGTPHEELGPDVRSVSHRRRTVILYRADGDIVEVLRVLHGGRDLRRAMQPDN